MLRIVSTEVLKFFFLKIGTNTPECQEIFEIILEADSIKMLRHFIAREGISTKTKTLKVVEVGKNSTESADRGI